MRRCVKDAAISVVPLRSATVSMTSGTVINNIAREMNLKTFPSRVNKLDIGLGIGSDSKRFNIQKSPKNKTVKNTMKNVASPKGLLPIIAAFL